MKVMGLSPCGPGEERAQTAQKINISVDGRSQTFLWKSFEIVKMGKFSSSCANSEHDEWKAPQATWSTLKARLANLAYFTRHSDRETKRNLRTSFVLTALQHASKTDIILQDCQQITEVYHPLQW